VQSYTQNRTLSPTLVNGQVKYESTVVCTFQWWSFETWSRSRDPFSESRSWRFQASRL